MIKTATLGAIYESQGLKEEAMQIYKDILKSDPNNAEASEALSRLKGKKRNFSNVNSEMVNFFLKMNSKVEFNEFERWLLLEG
jgi:tetratricopeptide (TPR) repeat protein